MSEKKLIWRAEKMVKNIEMPFYEMAFGPAHPGSGNFMVKLTVDGERIIKARSDPGYLHRGFEKLMEYRTPLQSSVLSDRIAVFEPLLWNLVYAEAVDEIMGYKVPERAKYIRVIMAELTRIQSHLLWFGAESLALGFNSGFMIAFAYRDYVLDLFEAVTGGRVYPAGYIRPGGVRWDLPKNFCKKCQRVLEKIEKGMSEFDKMLFSNPSFKMRTKGVGVLSKKDAVRLGATGQVLRACGMAADVRKDDPYEVYEKIDFDIPTRNEGDAFARSIVGRDEVFESIKIVKQALEDIPKGDYSVKIFPFASMKKGESYSRIESARGEACVYMASEGEKTPYRVKIRGPSFLHLIPVLEFLLRDCQIADVPVIYWSLNHCPADMDR